MKKVSLPWDQTQIRLLQNQPSDQGLNFAILVIWLQYCIVKSNCSIFWTITVIILGVSILEVFSVQFKDENQCLMHMVTILTGNLRALSMP